MERLATTGLWLAAAIAASGCGGFTPFEQAPPGPNNPGGNVDAGSDAPGDAPNDAADDNDVTGQLCLVVDLRTPYACASNVDFTNVAIAQVGTNNATTADATGAFTLTSEPGQFVVLRVGAGTDDFATTIVRLTQSGLTDVTIPLLEDNDASTLVANADVEPTAGTGRAVFIFSQQQGDNRVPRSDVTLTVPSGASALYETLISSEWNTVAGKTGDSGVAIGFNVAAGSRIFSADYSSQTATFTQVPIESNAWTFVTGLFTE